MESRFVPWIKGVAAAAVTMLVYAVPLGLFTALVLLVVAMEEGGNVLSSETVPLTKAVILLSEGVGFHAGAIVVGVTPLLMTLLLIALIRTVCLRTSCDARAYAAGLIVWLLLQQPLMSGLNVQLDDGTGTVLCKAAVIYTIGFLLAAVPRMSMLEAARGYVRAHSSASVRRAVRVGIRAACILLACILLAGLGTCVAWIVLDHHEMDVWFNDLHMQNGSRILMCVIGLAWLPNACLWAVSWLFGGGFAIGQAATYTLWRSTTDGLPRLPLFALFPHAVEHEGVRTLVMLIPLCMGIVVGLLMMLTRGGFRIRVTRSTLDMRTMLKDFAYPAGAFCISAALLSLFGSLMFWVSNGTLGTQRLAHVGVDIQQSTNAVARPCAVGLFIAWGSLLILAAVVYAVQWLLARRATHHQSSSGGTSPKDHTEEKPKSTHRVVNSTPPQKEKQGDDEPTVTTGVGVRISQGRH